MLISEEMLRKWLYEYEHLLIIANNVGYDGLGSKLKDRAFRMSHMFAFLAVTATNQEERIFYSRIPKI